MLVAAGTVLAGVAVYFWALRPLGFASYLSSTWASEADIIRQYWPHRLVPPDWVSDTPSTLMNWSLVEAVSRLTVIVVFWLLIIIGLGGGVNLRRMWRRERGPNPRAGGDGGTAHMWHAGHQGPAAPHHDRSAEW
jgi:hypothetical protein